MHSVRIDRTKPLSAQPHVGHNRYHPDIAPVAEVGEGEEIALETRDALDGQITPEMTNADLASIEAGAVHPLTGPVFVKDAQPGDLLEIEFTDIVAEPTAFSAIVPGLGFLRDVFTEPFLVHWRIAEGWATSAQIPGVRIPGASFMGVSAVAPSAAKLAEWTAREQRVIDNGGFVLPARPGRCGAGGPLRSRRAAHLAAAREWRQFRRQTADPGCQTLPSGIHRRRVVLDRRRPFCAGRRRGLRDRSRDGRDRRGALQAA
jgi:formamidase